MDFRSRSVMRHFNRAKTSANPYLKYALCETDINTWYVLVHSMQGTDDEFKDGQYIIKLVIPDTFPTDPPAFYVLTPNGVYDTTGKVCIGVGEFHAQSSYPSTLGISGFCEQIVSGMIGWKTLGEGTRLMNTTVEQKKTFAVASSAYNAANHADILVLLHR